jgi:hypothetical protein
MEAKGLITRKRVISLPIVYFNFVLGYINLKLRASQKALIYARVDYIYISFNHRIYMFKSIKFLFGPGRKNGKISEFVK